MKPAISGPMKRPTKLAELWKANTPGRASIG